MPPSPRTPLNRAAVLNAAVALADAEGLDAVSMRSLATRLGVVPMALYKHVADKADLTAGMIDTVIAGYPAPGEGLEWSASVRARIHAARAELERHPWLRQAIEQATTRTPAVLGYLDAVAGDLARGGLSYDLVHYGMHALGHRVWGFNPEAFAPPPGQPAPTPPDPETTQLLARMFPHIAAVAGDAAARNPSGACDDDREFDFTLDLLLEAIARLHASGWVSR